MNGVNSRLWSLKRLLEGMSVEEQVDMLLKNAEKSDEQYEHQKYDMLLNSAMVADICDALFGSNANGAPSFMSYSHAGWVCGPTPVKPSFVRYFLQSHHKENLKNDLLRDLEDWESFIEKLRARDIINPQEAICQRTEQGFPDRMPTR